MNLFHGYYILSNSLIHQMTVLLQTSGFQHIHPLREERGLWPIFYYCSEYNVLGDTEIISDQPISLIIQKPETPALRRFELSYSLYSVK